MNIESKLATRTKRMSSSAIRELLKVAAQPGMISLGGGYPAPKSFPLDMLDELTATVVKKHQGEITLISELNVGSSFTIHIPALSEQELFDV